MFPQQVCISQRDVGFEIEEHKIIRLTLGNWTDAGWYWNVTGPDCEGELFTFLCRMLGADKEVWENFEKALKDRKVTYKQIAQKCIEELDKEGMEALYSLTGDNCRWHFGSDNPFDHVTFEDEYEHYIDCSYNLTDTEFKIAWDNVFMETRQMTFEDFSKFSTGSDLVSMTKDILKETEDFDELKKELEDMNYNIEEDYFNYSNDVFYEAMEKTIKKMRNGEYNEKNMGLRI